MRRSRVLGFMAAADRTVDAGVNWALDRATAGRVMMIGLLTGGLLMSGCCAWADHQHKTPRHALSQLEYGMTREQVLAVAGEPYSRDLWPCGDEQWYYYVREYRGFPLTEPYRVTFDTDGRVYYMWDQ